MNIDEAWVVIYLGFEGEVDDVEVFNDEDEAREAVRHYGKPKPLLYNRSIIS